jgi:tetratricopeptide (TPR) repeat protein
MTLGFFERGIAAVNSGNVAEGVQWFEKAMQINPQDAETVACLGQALFWLEQRETGIAYLRQAGVLLVKNAKKSKDITQIVALSEQLQSCDDHAGSIKLLQQAILLTKNNPRAFQLLAQAYSRLNNNDLALAAAGLALKLVPTSPTLNIFVASLEARSAKCDKAKLRLENVLSNTAVLTDEEAYRAHKELALVLDKLEDFPNVFEHLHAAELLCKRLPDMQNQDAGYVLALLETYHEEFDKELLTKWQATDFADERQAPVFLLGFLRSGTTMAQEVLATHPDVFVADETEFMAATRVELQRISQHSGSVAQQLKRIDSAGICYLRRFYWQKVEQRFGSIFKHKLFIDKTTLNTIDIGLINCIFPDAKVLFVLRDPRDVCLSCYMQTMLPSPVSVHLSSWQSTLDFYLRVMTLWSGLKQDLTVEYFEFRYEDAVVKFETTFKTVFAFLGLPWNPSVKNFHKQASTKLISSPSYYQVSTPLYLTSVARWKNYPDVFLELTPEFRDMIKVLGYEEN